MTHVYETPEWHKQVLPYFAKGWIPSVSCGNGWQDIVLKAINKVKKLGVKWEIFQIKEKFGSLRIYANIVGTSSEWLSKISTPGYQLTDDDKKVLKYTLNVEDPVSANEVNNEFYSIIIVAEAESLSTCEECGKPGKRRSGDWIQVLCTKCWNKTKKGKQ